MRFLIREMDYEVRLAAGKLRFEQNGQSTGAVEEWRLNAAVEGYRFLRVDLDAREAQSGQSTLYHLILNPAGQPERLKFRFDGNKTSIVGDVMFLGDQITLTHIENGERTEQDFELDSLTKKVDHCSDRSTFWFPSTLGLSLLAGIHTSPDCICRRGTITLTQPGRSDVNLNQSLFLIRREVSLQSYKQEEVVVGRESIAARPLTISWQDQIRRIWLDESSNLPLRLERQDGLTAIETRYIRNFPKIDQSDLAH